MLAVNGLPEEFVRVLTSPSIHEENHFSSHHPRSSGGESVCGQLTRWHRDLDTDPVTRQTPGQTVCTHMHTHSHIHTWWAVNICWQGIATCSPCIISVAIIHICNHLNTCSVGFVSVNQHEGKQMALLLEVWKLLSLQSKEGSWCVSNKTTSMTGQWSQFSYTVDNSQKIRKCIKTHKMIFKKSFF